MFPTSTCKDKSLCVNYLFASKEHVTGTKFCPINETGLRYKLQGLVPQNPYCKLFVGLVPATWL